VLTAAGLSGAVLAGRSRPALMLSGAALLAASAVTRFGVFDAGRVSCPPGTRSTPSSRSGSAWAPGPAGRRSPARPRPSRRTRRPRRPAGPAGPAGPADRRPD
jgi:hypothetical protein